MSEYYFYCLTCSHSERDATHYDAEELLNLWAVRHDAVRVYESAIPMRVHDGLNERGIVGWLAQHKDHDVQINTTNSCGFFCDVQKDNTEVRETIALRQLVSSDGLRSEIVACEPGVPRTVQTVCKPKSLGVMAKEFLDTKHELPNTRRYHYRKEIPAIIRIYEEEPTK